jgi:uncharacterized protein
VTSSPAGAAPPRLKEPLVTFLAVTAISCALFWSSRSAPLLRDNLHGLLAILFLYAPAVAGRLSGRGFSYEEAGLHARPLRLNLLVAGLAGALTWPLFVALFVAFYETACGGDAPAWFGWWAERFGAPCLGWRGLSGARPTLPEGFALLALSQLLVIAVPEELFFRGYLQGRLEARFPSRRRFLGAPVGPALLLSSLLFALGHVLVDFDPQRFSVFFPGLVFGWMRARTGSIAAGALYHALCNLLTELLRVSFF